MTETPILRIIPGREDHQVSLTGVYLITDQQDHLVERVTAALRGGVCALQYRYKGGAGNDPLTEAQKLRELTRSFGVPFIINDSIELARLVQADGVHLGQEDGTVAEARQQLGSRAIIGVSTHTLAEALKAQADGASYIGFGAMYPTGSKEVTYMPGTQGLAEVRAAISIPIIAIGGITPTNASRVIDAGADGIAVISAVLNAPRPDIAVAELRLIANRRLPFPRGGVLSIAGSDCGGGAGIQADLKVITLLGSYAATAITALTIQNTTGVKGIHAIPPSCIADQIEAVISDIPIDVIKTGMLHTPAVTAMLAEYLHGLPRLIPTVIDPVMVAKGGASLLAREAVQLFCSELLPQTYLLTPNIPEAEQLLDRPITTVHDMEQAARDLSALGAARVLIKGGHLSGTNAIDVLFDGTHIHHFSSERIATMATHGTGCSYASAIAAFLSQGEPLVIAVSRAKQFITQAIRNARPMGKGHGPINHYLAAKECTHDPA